MADTVAAIELKGISKSFGPVQANRDINISVPKGTIHGIIGENGAGKSTLMSILYGFYKADAGEIFINGKLTPIPDSQSAIRAGIGMVFQHFKLVQNFTVLENVILGVEEGPLLKSSLSKGTIHGIIGENGAGKSTLMSILYGFYKADAGEIFINGKLTPIPDSQSAIRAGIGMVFQHFKLVQNFTVLENVILGVEEGPLLNASLAKARKVLADLSREYELDVNPDALIEDLSVGHQQRVEILKALYRQADILILDEPTGVLTPDEADHLFRILKGLKDQGKTIILITHKLREIMETTDNVSVMRRGTMVGNVKTSETSPEQLAELMVGRKVLLEVDKEPAKPGEILLKVENLRVRDLAGVERLKGISFEIRRGEILGIAGVAGNGQSELLGALGGIQTATGHVTYKGADLPLSGKGADGRTRRDIGIGHIPEDRQVLGLIMDFAAWEDMAFGYHYLPKYQKNAFTMDNDAIKADTAAKMATYDVRPPIATLAAKNFSGGNQQKIVVAREIEADPDVLLIGQPTRGVDIGAIEFIHKEIIAMRDAGKAILLVSVELDEILSLSDRIAVMFDGQIMGFKDPEKTNERELGLLMAGVSGEAGK